MKVIDERGKLFGKLNIIDLLVVLFILAALAVVGTKVLGGGGESAATTKLTYTVRVTGQTPEVAQRVGEHVDKTTGRSDRLAANGQLLDAYVVDFWTEPTVLMKSVDCIMVPYEGPEGALVDLCFVIEANISNTVTSEVGTQEVRIGKSHIVKTAHFEFVNGTIENCTWGVA